MHGAPSDSDSAPRQHHGGSSDEFTMRSQEPTFGEHDERRQHPRFLSTRQPSQQSAALNNPIMGSAVGSSGSSPTLHVQAQASSQSSLMRQFSEKIKTQAERLQKLEAYKRLCERRILDFEPQHALPITEDMIGTPGESTRDPTAVQAQQTDFKRQLALKEQDLVYAKQRAEKALKENEYLRQEIAQLRQSTQPDEPPGGSSSKLDKDSVEKQLREQL